MKIRSTLVNGIQYSVIPIFLMIHFAFQVLIPIRSHLYGDKLFYHEQGYRFSWRVMLMEKAGTVFFYVKKPDGKTIEVKNCDYLSAQQEKQMSTQPDMILQFAQYLSNIYNSKEVYAEAYVSVNGKGSRLFLDPKVNLAAVEDGYSPKPWILAQANR